jgi:23S rRNA (uracil1939-C5)-methyltransferase
LRVQVGSPGQEKLIALATDEDHIQRVLTPVTAVHYQIKGKNFRVSGGSFFQVNLAQAEKLVDLVLDRLGLSGREVVLDLYSGVGLFSAFLVEQAAFCTAIELYAPAVMDARENLKHAANVQLITGTMEKALPTIKGQIDAVVIDPPRAGVKKAALDALLRLKPGQIIYVACDAGTLARDAKILAEQGYTLVDVQPLDMFPQTAHIEVVAHLRR